MINVKERNSQRGRERDRQTESERGRIITMSRLKDKRIKRRMEKRGVKECIAFEKVECWERKKKRMGERERQE